MGIVTGWLVVPKTVKDRLLQPATTMALPVIIKTTQNDNYTATLRSNEDGSNLQLEWINKSALTTPSALIYETPTLNEGRSLDGAGLVGRIDARGV